MFSAIRQRLRPRSLRSRLTLWYLLLLGGALASLAVFVFLAQVRSHHLELDAELRVRAHHFAAEHLPALLRLDAGRALAEQPRVAATAVAIRRRSGTLVFRSPAFPELDWAGERRAVEAAREATAFVSVAGPSGSASRIVTIPVRRPGAEDLVVQMAGPTASARSALRHLAVGMALFVVLVLSVASFGGDFLARRALAPVEEIVQRVSEIQSARLGDRLDLQPGSRELKRLVQTLNGMLDRIEASLRTARRFAADASHELQTPMAAMRAVVSRVVVSVRSVDGHATVAVRDEGCGIPLKDVAHIFEPFYRADPARARDSGGTGLGLAIVDQVVRLHGGHVSVSSAIGRGSTFTVLLPLGPAAAPRRASPPASLAEPSPGQMKAS